ncbi:MAG: TIGR02217 family protein [Mesorhizobium sp.]
MSDFEAFHEVRFPVAVSFGATGGPARRNEIVLLTSGHERRNARFADSRRSYDAGTGLRSLEDVHDVVAFFEARRGSLHGFRFRDPFDMKSCRPHETPAATDQALGTGDGTTAAFALAKTYGEGVDVYRRPIAKPVAGSVRVAVGGVEQVAAVDFEVDHATGLVSFLPGHVPAEGAAVTAGFEFDVPVRFDAEQLSVNLAGFRAGQIPTIPLIEILP